MLCAIDAGTHESFTSPNASGLPSTHVLEMLHSLKMR